MDVASLLRYTPAADVRRTLLEQWGREHLVRELWQLSHLALEEHVLPAEALMVALVQVPGLWEGTPAEQVTLAKWFASACLCAPDFEGVPLAFSVELACVTKDHLDGPVWGRLATLAIDVCTCSARRHCDRWSGVGSSCTWVTNRFCASVKVVLAQPWEVNAHLCPVVKSSLLSCLASRDEVWEEVGAAVLPALWPILEFVSLHNEVALSKVLSRVRAFATIDDLSEVLAAQWLQPRFAHDEVHGDGPVTLCEQGEPWRQVVCSLFTEVVVNSNGQYCAADVNEWGPCIVMGMALTFQEEHCLSNLECAQTAAAMYCGCPLSVEWLVALTCMACSVAPCWWSRAFRQPSLLKVKSLNAALGSSREANERCVAGLTTSILAWVGELIDRGPVCMAHTQVQVVLQALQCFLEWWCDPKWSKVAGAATLARFTEPCGSVMTFVATRGRSRATVDVGVALAMCSLGAKLKAIGSAPGADAHRALFASAAAAVLTHFERVDWQPLHSVHLSQLWTAMVVSDLADLTPFLALACRYVRGFRDPPYCERQPVIADCLRVMHVWATMAHYVTARASAAWSHSFFGTLLSLQEGALWYGRVRDMLEAAQVLPDSHVDALALVIEVAALLAPRLGDLHAEPMTALVIPRGLLHQCSPWVIDRLIVDIRGELAEAAKAVAMARDDRWSCLREVWCTQVLRAASWHLAPGKQQQRQRPRRRFHAPV
jgi:hypothetical protein